MILDTDDDTGAIVIKASGENGRVVLLLKDGGSVTITERNGKIWTTEHGFSGEQFNAGKTAGIVKGTATILMAAALLSGCCTTAPQPVTLHFDASEERR